MDTTCFLVLPDGRRIAFRERAGEGPTVVFLPGYMSDMSGTKATALMAWAEQEGRGCLLLDYSGCGESPGEFAEGTLSRWREEVCAFVKARCTGPVILVGSSMGGWLMLLVARELRTQVFALVGIAAAPDFTDWGYDAAEQAQLLRGEPVLRRNPYGDQATPTYPGFWKDGQAVRQLCGSIPVDVPVRLLHGLDDQDVPPDVSMQLATALRSQDVQVTLIKAGDHRLSRESDLALMLRTIASIGPSS